MIDILLEEKKKINERIEFHIDNKKNQFAHVSASVDDTFDRLKTFSKGGKGVRGGLFIKTAGMFGFDTKKILYDIAAVLEILHASLLIHDDIMDNDEIRRGNPSMFAQYIPIGTSIGSQNSSHFGKSMGICVGNIGFFTALDIFRTVLTASTIQNSDDLYQILFNELLTVNVGQMDDILFSNSKKLPLVSETISMYTYKTAHYTFSLPFVLAATITSQPKHVIDTFEKLGIAMGILFQIKDDELGLFSTETIIGKPVGSDIRENKKTILRIFLENNANTSEKKYLQTIIKNQEFSSEEIAIIQTLLEKYKIKDYIKTLTQHYYSQTESYIQILPLTKQNKKNLKNLTDYLITRTS